MNFYKHLRKHGISPTKQRLEVASILLVKPQHLSADQVLNLLREQGSKISKATVYNTLNLFKKGGVVRELNIDSAKTIFDSTTIPHHHFFNVDTGEVIDIPKNQVIINKLPHLPAGTYTDDVEVLIKVRQE